MEVYAIDEENIDDFGFLFNDDAIRSIKSGIGVAFVVEKDERYVGGLCGKFVSPGDYRILSIYVLPEYRRQGVGSFMMETLSNVLPDKDMVLSIKFVAIGEDRNTLNAFFEETGFESLGGIRNVVCYSTVSKLANVKLKAGKKDSRYMLFRDMPSRYFKEFNASISGFAPLPEGGFDAPSIVKDVSIGFVDENRLLGVAICEQKDEGNIIFSSLCIREEATMVVLSGLLARLKSEVQKKYDGDTGIFIPCMGEDTWKLVDAFFNEDDVEIASAYYMKAIGSHTKQNDLIKNMPLSEFFAQSQEELYADDPEVVYLTHVFPINDIILD